MNMILMEFNIKDMEWIWFWWNLILKIWNEYDSDGSGFLEANELKVKSEKVNFTTKKYFYREYLTINVLSNLYLSDE